MAARFHYLFSQCLVLVLAAVVASCSSSLTTNNNIDLYVRSLPSLSQRAPYDIFPKRSQLTQSSYNPLSDLCGIGRSCSQACGSSFQTCPSNDQILHCFNPSSGQECCANGSGCTYHIVPPHIIYPPFSAASTVKFLCFRRVLN